MKDGVWFMVYGLWYMVYGIWLPGNEFNFEIYI